jgi:outer membrane murein-binding lipoprotein Lpp
MKTKIFLIASLLSITIFIGCSSNEKVDVVATSNSITAEDAAANSEIDATVDDVSLIAEDQFDMQTSLVNKTSVARISMLPACATITTVLTNDTFTRTIDFGAQGCALNNGNIVKGKVIISFSKTATLTRTISYSLVGFYHNGKLIEGNKTITRELKSTDLLSAVHPVTTHSIDMKITFANGKIYTRIGTRVREMIEGITTITNWEDDVYLVWGYDITTFPNGSKYTATIKTPLRYNMSCKKSIPVVGVIEITKNDGKASINFGKGECDNLATITVNGVSIEITIKK